MRAAVLACLLALAPAARAQIAPEVAVTLDPTGPVTVGTPLTVTATVLVPSYMPKPPVWPDLQIADAITRLPGRATRPVTERRGSESWSGVARTWEIVPQRAADYALGPAEVAVTYADPETNAPVEATVALPAVAFTATVPPGAEGIDPFLAATALTVTATLDGLPAAPKPGDAFTLTLTTTASGPPAMLLPPLAGRLATPSGLRAYPRQPSLTDGDPATRTEAVAYVIEAPGQYRFPALSVEWWNTAAAAPATAATDAVTIDVPAPPGWRAPGSPRGPGPIAIAAAAGAVLLAGAGVAWWRRSHRAARLPSERSLYRALRRSIRTEPPAAIRARLAAWTAARPAGGGQRQVAAALAALDRSVYGPPGAATADAGLRDTLLRAVADARRAPAPPTGGVMPLPPLNP